MRRAFAVALLAAGVLAAPPCAAHVGSPNVYYEGAAGPHKVRVVLRPPTAVPGIAEATVRVAGENLRVSIATSSAAAPPQAAVPAQEARPVPGAAGLYSAEIWLLETGAHAVRVRVEGAVGAGDAIVPLNAVNREPGGMAWSTAAALVLIAVLLIGGAALLGGLAAVSGAPRDGARFSVRAAGVGAAVLTAAAVLLLLRQGLAYDRGFRREGLFEPMPVRAESLVDDGGRYVVLSRVPDERGSRAWPRLVTDHGKLMHAFLIRDGGLDVFAHVHPRPTQRGDFVVAAPHLPPGDYLLYADITREDGLSETLSTRFALPAEPAATAGRPLVVPDADDSWRVGTAVGAEPLTTVSRSSLGGGYEMIWENPQIAGDPSVEELRFAVVDGGGRPVRLEPYMGMTGHAAVRRLDGRVFAHLHPVGSISMASQEVLARAAAAPDSDDPHAAHRRDAGADHAMHANHGTDPHAAHRAATKEESSVGFPYEFPMEGPYRIWIQVKVAGDVLTGVFDTQVTRTR
jgi:hypothetical protein